MLVVLYMGLGREVVLVCACFMFSLFVNLAQLSTADSHETGALVVHNICPGKPSLTGSGSRPLARDKVNQEPENHPQNKRIQPHPSRPVATRAVKPRTPLVHPSSSTRAAQRNRALGGVVSRPSWQRGTHHPPTHNPHPVEPRQHTPHTCRATPRIAARPLHGTLPIPPHVAPRVGRRRL